MRSTPLEIWYDLITADQLIALYKPAEQEQVTAHIERKARKRTSAGAARKLTETVGGRMQITEDPPLRVRLQGDELALEGAVFTAYRSSLPEYRRHLLDRFSFVDAARQVVGVGSVGMRVFLVLLTGRDGTDPLFLQIKQAGPSVYEPYCGKSHHANHGQRVVVGKRLIQSATDIFVGFTSVGADDFYVRQFRDMKVIPGADWSRRASPSSRPHPGRCSPVPTLAPATRSRSTPTSARAANSTRPWVSLPPATRAKPPATTSN